MMVQPMIIFYFQTYNPSKATIQLSTLACSGLPSKI